MTRGEFGMGMVATSMVFFVGTGIANAFIPVHPALAVGLVVWAAAGYSFARAMKGNRA